MTSYNLDIVIKAIDQASGNLRNVGDSLGALGQEASSTAQSLQPLGVGLAALSAAGGAVVGTAAMTAARVEVLGTVLDTVGEQSGYSAEQLSVFEAGLMEAGITAGASRQGLIQMMQAEIDLAHATDLARLAQNAAVIANLNSSEAYERLITGIQRGEIELLKTMGLTVDFNGAYKQMAAQLGKTTQELTASEKMQARLNETMRSGEAISGVYKAAMGDVGKKMGSLKGDFQDASNALGKAYLPAMEKAVDATRSALGWFTELDEGTQKTVATILGMGTAVTGTAGAAILAVPKIVQMGSSISTLAGFASDTSFALKLLAAGSNTAGLGMAGFSASVLAAAAPIAAVTAALGGLMYLANEFPNPLNRSTESIVGMGDAMIWLDGAGGGLTDSLSEVETATSNLTDGWQSGYSPALKNARKQTDGWAASLEATEEPLDAMSGQTSEANSNVLAYTNTLSMLEEALDGPISKANEQYAAEQARISHELTEARERLRELGAQHGDYDEEIAETEATLESLEGELGNLDAQHRAVMNQIVYDMMYARLATEGWTSAETELALETARAMGIIDEETWAAATNMNAALDSFAAGESVDNTIDAILGIGEEISGLGPTAGEIGVSIGADLKYGADMGVTAFEGVSAAIAGIPKKIDVVTNYSYTGLPPWEGPPTSGVQEGYQHGTDYVPRTGWAYLHKGEAVLPAAEAAQYRAGDTTNINLTANYAHQPEHRLRDDVRLMQLLTGV